MMRGAGDLRSIEVRGRETRAQLGETRAQREEDPENDAAREEPSAEGIYDLVRADGRNPEACRSSRSR